MGKAADNERIRLKAMFYNNMSVGLWLVGVLYPVLNSLAAVGKFLFAFWFGQVAWSSDSVLQFIIGLVVFVGTTRIAILLRQTADEEIQKIQD
jgi:nitrate reductase NapE component